MPIRNIKSHNLLTAFAMMSVLLVLIAFPYPTAFANIAAQTEQVLAPIDDFQRLDAARGWILTGGQLFWTSDSGANWTNITPPTAALLRAAYFTDRGIGFAVSETHSADLVSFSLFVTANQGADWNAAPIAAYPGTDPRAIVSRIHLQFLDQNTGWVVLKQATSVNFNLGTVLRTTDGGESWVSSAGPAGGPIRFIDPSVGFMTGGPNNNILYRTADGGAGWSSTNLNFGTKAMVYLPNFLLPEQGHAAVVTPGGSGTDLTVYQTDDLGASWTEVNRTRLSDQESIYPVVAGAPGQIHAFGGGQLLTYWQTTAQLDAQPLGQSENFTQVGFADAGSGWALANRLTCQTPGNPDTCTASQALLQTADNGRTWQQLTAPQVFLQVPEETNFKFAREVDYHRDRTAVWLGQGFDMCEITNLANLQNWKNNSPFSVVNLYIGGVARACENALLSKAFIKSLSLQGWKFIPTWVGPQASCTSFGHTMSPNATLARTQGINNAIDASAVLESAGLGGTNGAGSVVYYDLEGFNTNDSQCLAAARAFIDGWVWKLHENGVTAGLYGSTCATALSEFYTIDNPPDVIWPAAWYSSNYYRSYVTTDGLPCLSDSLWGNHQRILQYTGAHNETWGGISIGDIDLNAVDGLVADITSISGAPDAALENGSFEDGVLAPWQIDDNDPACDWGVVHDSDAAHFGNYSLVLGSSGDPDCVGLSQPLTLTPVSGEQYRFAVWARSSSASDLRSLHLNLTGTGPTLVTVSQAFSGIGDQWVCLEVALPVNQSGLIGIIPAVLIDDTDGIQTYLDDAQLTVNTGSLCPTIPVPTGFSASDASDQDRVFLKWDEVPGASFYRVYRSTDSQPTEEYLDRSLTNTFVHVPAGSETGYYTVKACNAGGCSKSTAKDAGSIADPNLDFFDGFEDGNTAKWDDAINSPGSIYTCTAGKLNGAFGLCVKANLTSSAFLVHEMPAPSRDVELNFTFDPNSANLGTTVFNLVKFMDTATTRQALTLQIQKVVSGYQIRISAQDDAGNQFSTAWVNLTDQKAEITLSWWSTIGQLRTTSGGFSGALLRINGVSSGEISGLANNGLLVDQILVGGLVNAAPGGASGTYYLDDINYALPLFVRPSSP